MEPVTMNVKGDYASSVGSAFRDKQIITLQHPAYVDFSNDVTEELTRIAERAAVQRSTAQRLVVTSRLDPDESAYLAELYPEFNAVYVPMNKPIHAFWSASRVAANEWCVVTTQRYAEKVLHYGGSLLANLVRGTRGVHLESDPADELMLHTKHSDAVDAHRVFQDYATMQSDYGLVLDRKEYDQYLQTKAYTGCRQPASCTVEVEAMCVDLTVTPLSPVQVAMGMVQHKAELCHGFFIYHPVLLVQESGELPGVGIGFRKTRTSIEFDYPEGKVGVDSYSRASYACWLSSHCFTVSGRWFQLELLKNRGSFMFFRMVCLETAPTSTVYRHALDLPADDDYTLVKSWRLKKGFGSDPQKPSDWESYSFLARSRVVRRVREFAMQLQPGSFTRHAIKKQIRVVNNRWVVSGSTVNVSAPLSPMDVECLTTAIYSRAFVDRYESSQLSGEMMKQLKALSMFNSVSTSERVRAVAAAALSASVFGMMEVVDTWFRSVLDGISSYLSGGRDQPVDIYPSPAYVPFQSVTNTWLMGIKNSEVLLAADGHGFISPTVDSSLGGSLASMVQKYHLPTGFEGSAREAAAKLAAVVRVVTSFEDTRLPEEFKSDMADRVAAVNEMDDAPESRYILEYERAERAVSEIVRDFKHADDDDPVYLLNQLYLELFPSLANQRVEFDTFSLSLDPQDRTLEAPMLRMSNYFGLPPSPRAYFESRLKALNVPKRQNTAPELLTAITARNLSAPVVSQPQEEDVMIKAIWENFLDQCCVPSAKEKLLTYQQDPAALAEDSLNDWGKKARPSAVLNVIKDLEVNSRSLGDMAVDEYLVMLKADVKPTLSTKPVGEVTAPQVIVYHEKPLSALYSSIFRVLVRRFLSLLKPNYMVNLLKDTRDVADFITANHPFGTQGLTYLENDFGKYDKSQSRFAFKLEEHVFKQLGMNLEFLSKWVHGHVECSLRSVTVGLSLHLMYQRKSGDGTTAFGNVILNCLSVAYAYRGTHVVWAVFMGDDSLVCAKGVVADGDAVQTLAEVFNLTAKYYVTEAPYFASNFVVLDDARLTAKMCPDVVKRIERLSMHVTADDPQWKERHISFSDSMAVFRDPAMVSKLAVLLPQRYEVSEGLVRGAASALGTLVGKFDKFRNLWSATPIMLQA